MENYQIGRIYKITSKSTNDVYIGATKQKLKKRLANHKQSYKNYLKHKGRFITSFNLIKYGDEQIECLEEIKYNKKYELALRERYYIDLLHSVNKKLPTRTAKEYHIVNFKKINEQKNVKYKCGCGGKYTHTGRTHHFKRTKHINYIIFNEAINELLNIII